MQIFIYARAFKWLFASRAQTWVDPGALQALLEGKLDIDPRNKEGYVSFGIEFKEAC